MFHPSGSGFSVFFFFSGLEPCHDAPPHFILLKNFFENFWGGAGYCKPIRITLCLLVLRSAVSSPPCHCGADPF